MQKVKPYTIQSLESGLILFRSNTPKFFAHSEERLLENYLTQDRINYYLFFNKRKKLVAAGGYEYEHYTGNISLTWGMVHGKSHHEGYGTWLMEYRLRKIKREFTNPNIILNTSQYTFRFYEKFGFRIEKITENYYTKGLHRYDMKNDTL